jgi:colicin import membrane protein
MSETIERAKAAVFKADTLPVSKESDVFQELRNINLTVEPEL